MLRLLLYVFNNEYSSLDKEKGAYFDMCSLYNEMYSVTNLYLKLPHKN